MGRTLTYTCDACGTDVETPNKNTRFRLHLENERVRGKEFMADDPEPPILDSDKYFCSIGCLSMWVQDNTP